jgi:hypothetical protein
MDLLSQLPDAEPVCGGYHGQLRLPDAGLFHSRRSPPRRVHQGGQQERFVEAQVMQIHRANQVVVKGFVACCHSFCVYLFTIIERTYNIRIHCKKGYRFSRPQAGCH